MDDELYDEFGNYIGPDLESSSEEEDNKVAEPDKPQVNSIIYASLQDCDTKMLLGKWDCASRARKK